MLRVVFCHSLTDTIIDIKTARMAVANLLKKQFPNERFSFTLTSEITSEDKEEILELSQLFSIEIMEADIVVFILKEDGSLGRHTSNALLMANILEKDRIIVYKNDVRLYKEED